MFEYYTKDQQILLTMSLNKTLVLILLNQEQNFARLFVSQKKIKKL